MLRRLRNGLSLASAVICLGSLILIGCSILRMDRVAFSFGGGISYSAHLVDGTLELARRSTDLGRFFLYMKYSSAERRFIRSRGGTPPYMTRVRWTGIAWGAIPGYGRYLTLPLWIVPIVAAVPPICWWRRRRTRACLGFAVEGCEGGVATVAAPDHVR